MRSDAGDDARNQIASDGGVGFRFGVPVASTAANFITGTDGKNCQEECRSPGPSCRVESRD